MYPLLRFASALLKARKESKLSPLDAHVSHHICMPWDIDPWIELNNGRTLTLYDLGRIGMSARNGFADTLRKESWGITVAGSSVRYRRRIGMFDRFTMVTRTIGWDERFFYVEQSLWRKGECCNQMLLRGAVISLGKGPDAPPRGLVPTAKVFAAVGGPSESPPLPEWVHAWIDADALRPWPPVLEKIPADIGEQAKGDLPA